MISAASRTTAAFAVWNELFADEIINSSTIAAITAINPIVSFMTSVAPDLRAEMRGIDGDVEQQAVDDPFVMPGDRTDGRGKREDDVEYSTGSRSAWRASSSGVLRWAGTSGNDGRARVEGHLCPCAS
jgi:hypothetical protein